MRNALLAILGVVLCHVPGYAQSQPITNAPDSSIQQQISEAGVALLKVPGDTTKNYLSDLKGERVPAEVRTLEKLLKGDRSKMLQQLVYYINGVTGISDPKEKEQRGWVTLAIAAYFNFTPEEVDQVAKIMPPTKDFRGVPSELVDQAKATHPTKPRTVP